MERICIIIPNSPFLADARTLPSLGPLSVAAELERNNVPVDVIDLNSIENEEDIISQYCSDSDAKIFALGCTSPQLPMARSVIESIRKYKPEARCILGGPHVTLTYADYKREKGLGMSDGRAHRAFRVISELANVLVSGDGQTGIMAAIRPNSPHVIDGDNPDSEFWIQENKLSDYPWSDRKLIDMDSYEFYIEKEKATHLVGMLACPYQCFADDTLIGLPNGLFYPKEAEGDDIDICPEGHIHHLGNFGNSKIVSNGIKRCLKVETETALSLTLTPNHPVLCAEKERLNWKDAEQIRVGDYIAIEADQNKITDYVKLPPISPAQSSAHAFLEKNVAIPAILDEKVAYLIGALIGDGSMPRDGRAGIHFAIKERTEEKIKKNLYDCFGFCGATYKAANTDKMQHLWVYSRRVRKFFEESVGVDCKNKLTVPKLIRRSPKSVVLSFLSGLWDTDGYTPKDKSHSYLATKSRQFAEEVAYLAMWVGLGAIVHWTSPNPTTGERHSRVSICLESCWDKKDGNGHPCLTSSIPVNNRRIYRSPKSRKLHWRTSTGRKQSGVSRTLLKEKEPNHPLLSGKYLYCQVKEINEVGFHQVYDVSVPQLHRFTANGISLHNCSFCGGRLSPFFRRTRKRTTSDIIGEMRHLYREYGLKGIFLADDESNLPVNFVDYMNAIVDLQEELGVSLKIRAFAKANLLTEAQAEAMARAGLRNLLIGFESGSERILTNIKKKSTRAQNTEAIRICKKYGISVKFLMSIGHVGEDISTIKETHQWLLDMEPEEFDVTIITVYPSVPYSSYAAPHPTEKGVWIYTADNGDILYFYETDFSKESAFYKGIPGSYSSLVWTSDLSRGDIVELRDWIEDDVRTKLKIPWPTISTGKRYEATMGMLPGYVYKRSK